jgi:hypothetical protein
MSRIHPSPGNHDYDDGNGEAYFGYFGVRAGPPERGYYSYDVGNWHAISLNSELYFGQGNDDDVRAQEDWLRSDLKDRRSACTLAYFHRPLFNSGKYGPTPKMQGLWNILYESGVDLVLNGHEHHYERFLPQTPSGVPDPARGIVEIIAGTGGGDLRGGRPASRNSVAEIHGHFGVLKLTLGKGEYRHAFLDIDGRVWDAGSGKCH